MKYRLSIGSAILLTIAFALNSTFLQSALVDGYQVSEITRFLMPIQSAGDIVEDSLSNESKRLTISEIREVLEYQRQAIRRYWENMYSSNLGDSFKSDDELVNLSIVLKSGSKLVTTAAETLKSEIPAELTEQILEISNGNPLSRNELVDANHNYLVPQLLYDSRGRWIGSLIVHFNKEALRQAVGPRLEVHFAPTLIIGVCGVFGFLFLNLTQINGNRGIRKKIFVIDFVLIILASLLCSLFVNAVIFQRQILDVSKVNARETATEIASKLIHRPAQQEIGVVSGKQNFGFSDAFFLLGNYEAVILTDASGTPVYRYRTSRDQNSAIESTIQNSVIGHISEKNFWVSQKIAGISLGSGFGGTIVVYISKQDIFRNSASMLTNGLTILLITTLVIVECLLLYLYLLVKHKIINSRKSRYEIGFVRPAMFLFLFGIDISLSFVPLHMQSFDADLFGLSSDIVAGLPISAEFLCVGIFLLVAGIWVDRRGWHEPFFIGLFIVGMGTLFSWAATGALQFILSRAMVGVGYGMTLMAAQGMIISFGGKDGRATGFANLFAGLYSGSICGAAAGAILAERFGYEKVFFAGAVVVFALIFFAWKFMGSAIEQPGRYSEHEEKSKRGIKLAPLLKLLGNPVFIALSLLSSLPASIAVTGFIHFFTPVFLDQIGARESTIGQVLILYGICLIYFGPPIGRLIDRSNAKRYYMLTGGLLGGLAFATFDANFGVGSMIVSIFLLGLSSSFVLSSQSTIVLELAESRILGEGTSIGIFRSISRIGQVIGPVIFGWVLLSGDLNDVINGLGICYIVAMVILAIFVRKPVEKLKIESVTV